MLKIQKFQLHSNLDWAWAEPETTFLQSGKSCKAAALPKSHPTQISMVYEFPNECYD